MSVTRTFTVTVVSTGSGNKYFIDGVQQATINIAENGTYKFDQSDSSNSSHPLRFSTTSDGTHGGGSQYTTGVTTYGTPGSDGAYTQITVAESAPTLYYYCTNHSGMGGQANTVDDNTWGMWAWGTNEWGDQGPIEITLTGQSATSSVGSVEAAPTISVELTGVSATSSLGSLNLDITTIASLTAPSTLTSSVGVLDPSNQAGWGRQRWGNSGWGVEYSIELSGVSATTSVGTPTAEELVEIDLTGVSATTSVGSVTGEEFLDLSITGVGATLSLGTVIAQNEQGWGRDAWGDETWGESFDPAPVLDGQQATASVGSLSPADVIGITGVSATTSLGSPTVVGNVTVALTGQSASTSVGTINIIEGIGLDGQSATSSVGSLTPADVIGVTGVSSTTSLGDLTISSNPVIIPTGFELTSSNGSLSPADVMGITGQSLTSSVGTGLTIDTSTDINLTGLSATSNVAVFGTASGFGIQAYSDVDTGSNSSYTDVATGSNTSYSDVA